MSGYDAEARGDEYLYGDYSYGIRGVEYAEDNNLEVSGLDYGSYLNEKSRELNRELWGDDDKIYGGDNVGFASNQYLIGGDGDDIIRSGNLWAEANVYGNYGDDTIYGPNNWS